MCQRYVLIRVVQSGIYFITDHNDFELLQNNTEIEREHLQSALIITV